MNIDTIKKYKNEFDHFVNGGKLLWARARDYKLSWLKATGNHQEFFNTNDEYYIYIIDDEYVEFRKALAEGKTVQANINYWSFPETEKFNWQDIASPDSFNKFNLLNLRIKPDEPKFKVGDFVRYVRAHAPRALEINNINGDRYNFTNSEMSCLEHELEPWSPVKGEWCWFYDNLDRKYSHLAQFYDMNISEDNSLSTFMSNPIIKWYYCEPFLNSRPSYLKDE